MLDSLFDDPDGFRKITGITIEEFNMLFGLVRNLLESVSIKNPDVTKLKQRKSTKRIFTPAQQFLLFMIWIRQYVVGEFLAWIAGCDSAQIYKYNYATLVCFSHTMNIFISLPPRSIRNAMGVNWRNVQINLVGDGVEQPVSKSIEKLIEKTLFSGKKCQHTFTKLVYCSANGYVFFASDTYTGSKTDAQLVSLPENFIWEHLDSDEYIALDKGFKGFQQYWKNVVLPFMYAKEDALESEHIQFNNKFKSIRTVIENVFCAAKKFRICSDKLRVKTTKLAHAKEVHNMAWRSCLGIVNLLRCPLKSFPLPDGSQQGNNGS